MDETTKDNDQDSISPEEISPGESGSVESSPEEPKPHVLEDCARAPLNRRWSIKLTVIAVVFIGFGGLGLYDAVSAYPARGERFSDWAKWQYLEAAKSADQEEFGMFRRSSSVANPVEEYERLSERDVRDRNLRDAQDQTSTRTLRAAMYNARREWLGSLDTISQLTPERTTIESPQELLDELKAKWSTSSSNPSPLKSYDIPSQWGIMIVSWFIGAWVVLNMIKVRSRRFAWDSSHKTLTLPGPISVSPDDLEEIDKRKWDKFIVFLKLKGSHSTHADQEIKVDTYTHKYVEDWILAMEEDAFGSESDVDDSNTSNEPDAPSSGS